jgi:hypothetical protein
VPVWHEGWQTSRAQDDEVVRQLVENTPLMAGRVDTRSSPAASTARSELLRALLRAGTGQIEDVLTLEPFRNRGLARATVSVRSAASREAARPHVPDRDRDDWPKELYAKLGFDEIGRIWEFVSAAQVASRSNLPRRRDAVAAARPLSSRMRRRRLRHVVRSRARIPWRRCPVFGPQRASGTGT